MAETNKRPFGIIPSIFLFGIPTLGLFFVYYGLMPMFISMGWLPFYAYAFAFALLFIGLIIAALVGYWLEADGFTWSHFAQRFRLRRMNRKDWLWTFSGFFIGLALFFAIQLITTWLLQNDWIPLPNNLPAFLHPITATAVLYDEAAGSVQSNWAFLITSIVLLILNVLGEELWWRGYILPRQELAFGKNTWWIHGILWTLFHAALWWNLLNLLPLTMSLVYVAVRRRSTTTGIVSHALHKTDFFLVTIPLFLFGVQ